MRIAVGIDLAKNVLAVHGIDESDKGTSIPPRVERDVLRESVVRLPPCLADMEAHSEANHCAREFTMLSPVSKVPINTINW